MAHISLVNTMRSIVLIIGLALVAAAEVVVDVEAGVADSFADKILILRIEKSGQDVNYPTECPKVDPEYENVVLPHEDDCTKYYSCYRGTKTVMDCPEYNVDHDKLYFNRKTHLCDWPENVDCVQSELFPKRKLSEPRVSLPIFSEPTTTSDPDVEGCVGTCPAYEPGREIVTKLPHKDCTKYCFCTENGERVFLCPAELEFSPTEKKCVRVAHARCKGDHRDGSKQKNGHDEALMNILGYNERFRW